MRSASPLNEQGLKRSIVRGRRFLAASKQKKGISSPSTKPVKPKPIFLESSELDRSFKTCAYPSAVEIFKLSEQMEMPALKIKAEFQKRRQVFRQCNKLAEDAIIYSYTLPRLFLMLHFLCSRFNCTQQTLMQIAVFLFSLFSLWYSVYIKIRNDNFNEELVLLSN
ncbi:uncharacterized protein LOC118195209 [Stegodyphus dumicola]|uniref:uncharacterized protein LOC118195209 n=1 Tax=Stegodyphus dumicola TaxID=202533 RepID=UPI0015ADDEC7|nr:uncharacterized protein LOC118195209 [Stegodyphus dumicola]